MNAPTRTRSSIRLRGRSLLVLALVPEEPLEAWLAGLDDLVQRSPGFFMKRPTILDVSALSLEKAGLAELVAALEARDVRMLGIEGARPSQIGPGMPPLLTGGRESTPVEAVDDIPEPAAPLPLPAPRPTAKAEPLPVPVPMPVPIPPPIAVTVAPAPQGPNSLLIDGNVRSGQSINFPDGDVTVVGSIASGAEVIAAGSIHVYGAIRGRAIAGSLGHSEARIFTSRLEAELLAIDGLYQTAEGMRAEVRNRPVQAWLEGENFMIAALA